MSVELANALRTFDLVLGVLLFLGLCERYWVRSKPSPVSGPLGDRIAMRTAILSWVLLDLSASTADVIRYGEHPTISLAIRLAGHFIGVVYCAVAWSIDNDQVRHQRKTQGR